MQPTGESLKLTVNLARVYYIITWGYNYNVSSTLTILKTKFLFIFVAAANVVKAINESKDVQAFTLEGNTLGVEAAKAIAEALSKRKEFEVILVW